MTRQASAIVLFADLTRDDLADPFKTDSKYGFDKISCDDLILKSGRRYPCLLGDAAPNAEQVMPDEPLNSGNQQ